MPTMTSYRQNRVERDDLAKAAQRKLQRTRATKEDVARVSGTKRDAVEKEAKLG